LCNWQRRESWGEKGLVHRIIGSAALLKGRGEKKEGSGWEARRAAYFWECGKRNRFAQKRFRKKGGDRGSWRCPGK